MDSVSGLFSSGPPASRSATAASCTSRRGRRSRSGYRFVPEAWGRGYATEAAEASLAYGFDVLGLDEIVAVAYPDNAASRRVMEKIGMRYDGRGMYYGNDSVRYVTGRTPTGPVEIVTYDPAWPLRFEEERARIAEALGSRAPVIEHIGSTAVPGLAAKPVIDVLVGLRSLSAGRSRRAGAGESSATSTGESSGSRDASSSARVSRAPITSTRWSSGAISGCRISCFATGCATIRRRPLATRR